MFTRRIVLMAAGALMATTALAQDFPSRPITIIVPFAAGGGADVQTRVIAEEMSKNLGQSVIVDNRPGATGNVGLEYVATAAPDGYTLLSLSNTTVIARNFQNHEFDLPRLMTPVANFLLTPGNLVVNANKVPAGNMTELVEFLKANPGVTYTSSGNGSGGHLAMAHFANRQDLDIVHVGYRGAAPALAALLGGEVDMMVVDSASLQPQLDSPDLKVVAGASTVRSGIAPDIATVGEQGFPEAAYDPVLGISAPPGTPQAVVDRLAEAVKAAAESEAFRVLMTKVGNEVHYLDGDAFADLLSTDYTKFGQVMKDANITVN